MNNSKLEKIKKAIENMDEHHQIEILKILHNASNTVLNENQNGTFINLSDLDKETIEKLEEYMVYFQHQQSNLKFFENKKRDIQQSYFKDNKETFQ